MSIRLCALALVAAVGTGGIGGTALGAAPPLHVPFERYQLPNGLIVILHEDHRSPQISVNLWFRVGSKDERAGRTGFAHLFEHLMFMGTRRVQNGQFDQIMEAAGGSNNATTSEDRTNYFESGPANLLETFLWLESDRLASLADDMTKEKVDLQRDVVKNERRQSYENRPYGRVDLILPEHMFPVGHPYHHPVIGSHEDLTAASVDDVKDFFRTFYVASNASLAIAGDFKLADGKRLVEKYFAALQKMPEPPHAAPPPGVLAKPDKVSLTDAVELPRIVVAWHSPASFSPGDADCDLLAAVLGGGKSSRLYKSMVYQRKVAQSVEVEQRGMRYGSIFAITATAQNGRHADELELAIDEEIARLQTEPPTEDEIRRARAVVETQTLRAAERVSSMADLLSLFEFYFGDPGELEKRLLSRYETVTAAGVVKQAKAIFGKPRLEVVVTPEKKATTQSEKPGSGKPQGVK